VKVRRNSRKVSDKVPDERLAALMDAIETCPKTARELEAKSVKIQARRDQRN
jgi:ferredoxin